MRYLGRAVSFGIWVVRYRSVSGSCGVMRYLGCAVPCGNPVGVCRYGICTPLPVLVPGDYYRLENKYGIFFRQRIYLHTNLETKKWIYYKIY